MVWLLTAMLRLLYSDYAQSCIQSIHVLEQPKSEYKRLNLLQIPQRQQATSWFKIHPWPVVVCKTAIEIQQT